MFCYVLPAPILRLVVIVIRLMRVYKHLMLSTKRTKFVALQERLFVKASAYPQIASRTVWAELVAEMAVVGCVGNVVSRKSALWTALASAFPPAQM